MKNLVKVLTEENTKRKCEALKEVRKINFSNTSDIEYHYLRQFLPEAKKRNFDFGTSRNLKDYLKRRIEASFEKRLPKELKKLELNEVRELTEIVITVEWKKSRM